jgi:hypothetical protein
MHWLSILSAMTIVKLKLSAGDIFRFGDTENGWGYGQILRTDIIQYVVVFEPIFGIEAKLEEIAASPLLLSGWTSDARFFSGDWQVVGNKALRHVVFPEYKVGVSGDTWVTDVEGKLLRAATPEEAERLHFQTSHAPITFEDAFWAHHGKLPWDPWFDRLAIKA